MCVFFLNQNKEVKKCNSHSLGLTWSYVIRKSENDPSTCIFPLTIYDHGAGKYPIWSSLQVNWKIDKHWQKKIIKLTKKIYKIRLKTEYLCLRKKTEGWSRLMYNLVDCKLPIWTRPEQLRKIFKKKKKIIKHYS